MKKLCIALCALTIFAAQPANGALALTGTMDGTATEGSVSHAGNSTVVKIRDFQASGSAQTNIGAADFLWRVTHGNINTDTGAGSSHGYFTLTFNDGDFDGQTLCARFNGPVGDFDSNVVTASSGNFNTKKKLNQNGRGGTGAKVECSSDAGHYNGTYNATAAETEDGEWQFHVDLLAHMAEGEEETEPTS